MDRACETSRVGVQFEEAVGARRRCRRASSAGGEGRRGWDIGTLEPEAPPTSSCSTTGMDIVNVLCGETRVWAAARACVRKPSARAGCSIARPTATLRPRGRGGFAAKHATFLIASAGQLVDMFLRCSRFFWRSIFFFLFFFFRLVFVLNSFCRAVMFADAVLCFFFFLYRSTISRRGLEARSLIGTRSVARLPTYLRPCEGAARAGDDRADERRQASRS